MRLVEGNVLVALSYPRRVPKDILQKFDLKLVSHASDLPKGRGWSPANWAAESLATEVTLSLIEMVEEIDAGRIFAKIKVHFPIWMLWPEFSSLLESRQVETIAELLSGNWRSLASMPQLGEPTHLEKRTPAHCELNPFISIEQQWGKIRSSDPERYPNFFTLHGKKYQVRVDRLED